MISFRSTVYILGSAVCLALLSGAALAQNSIGDVTYNTDVAPILKRSCERCHRPNSVAPMSLMTYDEVRPWAPMIAYRTSLGGGRGTMPPWFVERDIGIQHFRNDESLTEEEIATLAAWAEAGAPEGNPANRPEPSVYPDEPGWDIGEPDLIVDLPPFTMEAYAPDWWGIIPHAPANLTEDRYVEAMQVLEISDIEGGTGGNFIYHHAIIASTDENGRMNGSWPVHEVGRNAEFFDPEASPLLRAGSQFFIPGVHMHSNDKTTTAYLRLGFKFHPRDYEPERRATQLTFGNGEIDLKPMQADQEVHLYHQLDENMKISTFEPHMHASGVRMCVEAIWGGRTETLSCVGYDHNWVKVYNFDEDHTPLLPAGTLLKVTGYFDTTPNNPNVVDPRNWQGLGHRSIDNMAIVFLPGQELSDEEFAEEVQNRRTRLGLAEGESVVGCPLCGFAELPGGGR